MNSAEKSVIQRNFKRLCDDMNLDSIIQILHARGILINTNVEIVRKKKTNYDKKAMLFQRLQGIDNAWNELLQALAAGQQSTLADMLKDSLEFENKVASLNANRVTNSSILTRFFNLVCGLFTRDSTLIRDRKFYALQQQLCQSIKEDGEINRQYWDDYLPVTKLSLAYQKLLMIETNGRRTKEIPMNSYDYLADPSQRIFLIEGDPGIGKSTYANKVAMDWANGDKTLKNTFDFVINTTWQNMKPNWKNSIAAEFGHVNFADCLPALLESKKTLIILDAFDENPLQEVMQEIAAKLDSTSGNRLSARIQ